MASLKVDMKNKYQCSGCSACAVKCPNNSITMCADSMGFLYPKINASTCINCGLCLKICPFTNNYSANIEFAKPLVYASRLKDEKELVNSQSGGLFYALSEYVLNNGGVVYGAGYTNNFKVQHKRVTTKYDREELRLSKYSQSEIEGIYALVKADIVSGKLVLFTGTPCQVAGVKSFIGNLDHNDNFITVDLVCHGVPSPKIWEDYLQYLGNKYDSKIIGIKFRDKSFGWISHVETIKLQTDKIINSTTYNRLYHSHYSIRLSCSKCPYTNLRRVGDITIGDYWGWHEKHSEFNDNLGVSLVIVSSNKGLSVFKQLQHNIIAIETDIEDCLQPQLIAPIQLPDDRSDFEILYSQGGFIKAMKKFGFLGLRYRIKLALKFIDKYKRGIRLRLNKILK